MVLVATQAKGFKGAMYIMADVPESLAFPRPARFYLLLADSL
jgi:hypothetical protein